MRSASVRSRAARSGSVAASAFATPLSADDLRVLVGDGVGDAFGLGEEPAAAGDCGGRCGAGASDPLDRRDQAPGVVTEALVPNRQRIAAGQTGEALRQILPARHDRALDQDRNDPHVAGKGGLDFQPDDVVWIIKPPTAPLVGRGQPLRADDRQQHPAGRHRAEDFLGEVHARLDRVHIDEDLALAETIGQTVIQPASKMAALLPTVANKDATALSYGHAQSRYRIGWRTIPECRQRR